MSLAWTPPANPFSAFQGFQDAIAARNRNLLFPQQQQLLQAQVQGAQVDVQKAYQGNLDNVIAATPQLPGEDEQTYKARLSGVVANGQRAGLYPPETAAAWLGGATSGNVPFSEVAREAAVRSQSPTAMEAEFGTPSLVNTGQTEQGIVTNRVTGQQTNLGGPAATIQMQNPPAKMSEVLNVQDPLTGQKTAHTFGEFFNPDGSPKGTVPPITDIGNLSNNAQASLGAAYGPQINQYETQTVPQAIQAQQTIANMRADAADFVTGPLANQETKWGELLQQLGVPVPNWSQFGTNETAAREEFGKDVAMLFSQQASMLHLNQTDASRMAAEAAVPQNYTSAQGIKTILGRLEGLYDMQAAGGKAWEQYKAKSGPQSFGEFSMEYPQRLPPLVFQSQYMTPAEIRQEQQGWSAARIADFNARVAAAKKQGWLPNAQ